MRSDLTSRVAAYAARHGLLPPGAAVLALVSGGADSTCLMHLLAAVHDRPVGVLTFDHGLRPESTDEARAVAASARALGLPVWIRSLDLEPGPAIQERARDARRAAAVDVAEREGFARVATGHTASDQAETVLFRIARGTGRTGAAGMAPREGVWVRPLLCVTAAETRAWCAERGLAWIDDPSNADPAYRRARVRHGLIPALDAVHPGAERAVARFADLLRDEGVVLEEIVDAAWTRCAGSGGGLVVAALAGEGPALARLLIRRLLLDASVSAESAWIDRVQALAVRGGRPIQLPGGIVAVDRGVLRADGVATAPPPEVPLVVPGTAAFGQALLRARVVARAAASPPEANRVALATPGPFAVRAPQPGDRLVMAGGGSQRVGTLLAGAGVPARHRHHVPVVVAGDGHVVWVAGYRADPTLIAPPGARATALEVITT